MPEIAGELPSNEVFEQLTGRLISTGTLEELGWDATSGDFVCRIDLSQVPEGGPYKIAVRGYARVANSGSLISSALSDPKKLSATALFQQSPLRLMLQARHARPKSARYSWLTWSAAIALRFWILSGS